MARRLAVRLLGLLLAFSFLTGTVACMGPQRRGGEEKKEKKEEKGDKDKDKDKEKDKEKDEEKDKEKDKDKEEK